MSRTLKGAARAWRKNRVAKHRQRKRWAAMNENRARLRTLGVEVEK